MPCNRAGSATAHFCRPSARDDRRGSAAPVTPPAASAAPQLAPQYARAVSEIEFLPNETAEDYVARMKKRREAAERELAAAKSRHSQAMQAIRDRVNSLGR